MREKKEGKGEMEQGRVKGRREKLYSNDAIRTLICMLFCLNFSCIFVYIS